MNRSMRVSYAALPPNAVSRVVSRTHVHGYKKVIKLMDLYNEIEINWNNIDHIMCLRIIVSQLKSPTAKPIYV